MRAEVYNEQAAIEALQRLGLSAADVARLLVATTNSVAA
jgi:3-oxoacyl-[acyl-carrier-protein] synthase III